MGNNNNLVALGLMVLLAMMIFGEGNIQFPSGAPSEIDGQSFGECSIYTSKSTLTEGESVIGKVIDGANNICYIWWKKDFSQWTYWDGNPIQLGASGVYSLTVNAPAAGTYIFRAICSTSAGEVICVTPPKTVVVTPPSGSGNGNGNGGAGNGNGGSQCYDSDGGDKKFVYGECTDPTGTVKDVCPMGQGTKWISEAYCSGGYCLGYSAECPDTSLCVNGQCVYKSCIGMWNPSEANCAEGKCIDSSETCIYVPASLVHTAYCDCVEPAGIPGGWQPFGEFGHIPTR